MLHVHSVSGHRPQTLWAFWLSARLYRTSVQGFSTMPISHCPRECVIAKGRCHQCHIDATCAFGQVPDGIYWSSTLASHAGSWTVFVGKHDHRVCRAQKSRRNRPQRPRVNAPQVDALKGGGGSELDKMGQTEGRFVGGLALLFCIILLEGLFLAGSVRCRDMPQGALQDILNSLSFCPPGGGGADCLSSA